MGMIIKIACWLLVIAGLVMGYEGLTDQDLVEVLVGQNSMLELIFDGAFGISAIIVGLGLIFRKI
ncbi:MAG: hypothetical protein SFW66_10215 [Gammaproteobacteria bacterium]|nr:hypothetical protein [Gammaproteobacteria bacterium]